MAGIPTGWPYSVPEGWEKRIEEDKGIIRQKGIFSVTLCYDIYNDPLFPIKGCAHWPDKTASVETFGQAGKAIQWANSHFEEVDE